MIYENKKIDIKSMLIGSFNLENIILAAAISNELNISENFIEKGVNNCSTIDGRMQLVKNSQDKKIILDYGHTPDAYLQVLETVKENYKLSIKVLFGAGGGRDHSKRPKMAEVVEKYSSECYLAPDNPRFENINTINEDVIKGFSNNNYHSFDDREKALMFALSHLKSDEILIIFGKGNEEYQEIEGVKHFYSDRDIIKKFYAN
jgi:UDP-N-acetylmuramoyl-L-alanyl-D-glutamate--2,6-diaminopimelate ligase